MARGTRPASSISIYGPAFSGHVPPEENLIMPVCQASSNVRKSTDSILTGRSKLDIISMSGQGSSGGEVIRLQDRPLNPNRAMLRIRKLVHHGHITFTVYAKKRLRLR